MEHAPANTPVAASASRGHQTKSLVHDRLTVVQSHAADVGNHGAVFPDEPPSDAGDSESDRGGQHNHTVDGITGPDSEYVILVSSDFHEFIVKRAVAYVSPTLKRILDQHNMAVKAWTVSEVLVNYPSLVVSKVAEYLVYKEYYERSQEHPPKFIIEPAMVLEVLLASQFLDI